MPVSRRAQDISETAVRELQQLSKDTKDERLRFEICERLLSHAEHIQESFNAEKRIQANQNAPTVNKRSKKKPIADSGKLSPYEVLQRARARETSGEAINGQ